MKIKIYQDGEIEIYENVKNFELDGCCGDYSMNLYLDDDQTFVNLDSNYYKVKVKDD